MWALFTRALARGHSATQVSIMNTSANFVLTALLGFAIFSEALPPLWWAGAALLVAGNVIIGRKDEGKTEEEAETGPAEDPLVVADDNAAPADAVDPGHTVDTPAAAEPAAATSMPTPAALRTSRRLAALRDSDATASASTSTSVSNASTLIAPAEKDTDDEDADTVDT